MTSWLKWRLCALFGTSLLAVGATYLHAQSEYPAPAKTPEEAAARFFQLLDSIHDNSASFADDATNSAVNIAVDDSITNSATGYEVTITRMVPPDGSISRAQFESFKALPYKIDQLLKVLFQRSRVSHYEGRVSATNGDQTIVEVAPLARPLNREVVVIAEDGGYRVDLKATFGRWNNLSGEKLDEQWFLYTEAVSPSLLQNGEILRLRCESQMRQQMLGMLEYTQDYDEQFPPAREWIDVLQPYVKSEQIFKCPAMPKGGNGYADNQYLSRLPMYKIGTVSTTISIYETSNPNRNWFGPGTGKAFRHQDGWNLAFADGHVKWYSEGASTKLQFKPVIVSAPWESGAQHPGTPPAP